MRVEDYTKGDFLQRESTAGGPFKQRSSPVYFSIRRGRPREDHGDMWHPPECPDGSRRMARVRWCVVGRHSLAHGQRALHGPSAAVGAATTRAGARCARASLLRIACHHVCEVLCNKRLLIVSTCYLFYVFDDV